jgi:hypothetical protein
VAKSGVHKSCASAAASVMMRAEFTDDELSQNLNLNVHHFFVGATKIFSSNLPIIELFGGSCQVVWVTSVA